MTPAEFRAARLTLGLTQAELAPLLGYAHYQRIGEIEAGRQRRVPRAAAIIMARLLAEHAAREAWAAKMPAP